MPIYHITTKSLWAKQKNSKYFLAPPLEKDGFIHCSTENQTIPTLNRRFKGKTDLILLKIDEDKVDSKIIYEDLSKMGKKHPHIYGQIPTKAVTDILNLKPGKNGEFDLISKWIYPLISVIIPTHNSSKFLSESVNSIINQDYKNWELLLIDDFSSDNTPQICKNFSKKDKRIKYLQNHYEKSATGARNTGLDNAKGEYIALLDHDDIALPTRFKKQIKFMESNLEVGVCGSYMKEFEDGDKTWEVPTKDEDIKALIIIQSPINNPTAFFRKNIFDLNNLRYQPQYHGADDYHLWTLLKDTTNFANIPEVLVKYRIHSTNTSKIQRDEMMNGWEMALSPLLKQLGINPNSKTFEVLDVFETDNFSDKSSKWKDYAIQLIEKILKGNKKTNVFPHKALKILLLPKKQLLS